MIEGSEPEVERGFKGILSQFCSGDVTAQSVS